MVVGLIVAFVLYRADEADVAASEALSNVALPQMTGASRGDTADAYLKVAATYPGSRAGARALLLAAGGLFVEGKYAEAKTQFETFNREYASSPFRGEALLGIASCLDAQGKTNEAVTAYKDLIDRRPSDYVLPAGAVCAWPAYTKRRTSRSWRATCSRRSNATTLTARSVPRRACDWRN